MASMKDIKTRIKSVQSTRQITKAMELVASSKMRKARERVENTRPYFLHLRDTLSEIAASNTDFTSVYLVERPVKKKGYVLIAGDRGLAGGYNSNMFKLLQRHADGCDFCVIPVGKKAVEFCKSRHMEIVTERFALTEQMKVADCQEMGAIMADSFAKGDVDEFYVGYTTFVSMLSQRPEMLKVLPINNMDGEKSEKGAVHSLIEYEPDTETLFNIIVPQYLSGIVMGALAESWASELAARRTAMDAASKNADTMVSTLTLQYNRARQAAITQEITEIVGGAGEG